MRLRPSRPAQILALGACALAALLSTPGCDKTEKPEKETQTPPPTAPHATHGHATKPAATTEPAAASDAPQPAPPPDQPETPDKPSDPRHVWIPGYWFWEGKQHTWQKGYWEDETAFATAAPPAARPEHSGRGPGAGFFYMPGYWHWAGKEYVWAPGHWGAPRDGMRYTHTTYLEEKGHWARHGLGWEKETAAWEKRYAGWNQLGHLWVHEGEVEDLEKRGERDGWRKSHLERKHVALSPWDAKKGAKDAKVTIVEFCDFECPFCAELAPKLKKIEEELGKDVAVVYKTMPLTSIHEHAMGAALAFQAAHRQGKAWPLHDKMFANQGALAKPDLEKYAKELHLDVAKLARDMGDPKLKEEIDTDAKQEGPLGVCCYTPRVFVNGRLVNAGMKLKGWRAVIDEEIKNADELIKAGTPLADVYKKFIEH